MKQMLHFVYFLEGEGSLYRGGPPHKWSKLIFVLKSLIISGIRNSISGSSLHSHSGSALWGVSCWDRTMGCSVGFSTHGPQKGLALRHK